jgi:hypothetical protein
MSSPFFRRPGAGDLRSRERWRSGRRRLHKALVDFEAVQQVPLNGGGGLVQVAR